jgi:hypothetical protein
VRCSVNLEDMLKKQIINQDQFREASWPPSSYCIVVIARLYCLAVLVWQYHLSFAFSNS